MATSFPWNFALKTFAWPPSPNSESNFGVKLLFFCQKFEEKDIFVLLKMNKKLALKLFDFPILIIRMEPVIATRTGEIDAWKCSVNDHDKIIIHNFSRKKSPPLSKFANCYVLSHVSLESGFSRN